MKFCDNFVRGPMIFFVPCEQIYRMQFLLGTFSVGFSFFFIRKQIWLLQVNPREFHSLNHVTNSRKR